MGHSRSRAFAQAARCLRLIYSTSVTCSTKMWLLRGHEMPESVLNTKKMNSTGRFRSSDLWVMNPIRFLCATMLLAMPDEVLLSEVLILLLVIYEGD